MSMPSQAPAWRQLTAAELAALPDARLGGSLGVIFAMAGALLLVTAIPVAIFLFVVLPLGGFDLLGNLGNGSAASPSTVARNLLALQQLVLCVWALIFTVMTLTRSPSTPRVASILMIVWAAAAILSGVLLRTLVQQNGLDIVGLLQFVPYALFDVAVAAAFWGYMHEGRRPNLYYQSRMRAN